jgi:galactonate dehydratase
VKIEDVRVHICNAGWRNWVFIEVETDTGAVGLGEATIEGRELTMEGHIKDLRRAVIGTDVFDISGLRRRLTRDPFWVGGFISGSGLAGIEIACWDLMGKALGVPVWQLLGGRLRDRVMTYANGWYFGAKEVEEWVERAARVVDDGFRALKFDPFGRAGLSISRDELEFSMDIISALRTELGPRIELLIEGHGRFSLESAQRVARRLEEFDCLFFEEPVPPGYQGAMKQVAQNSRVNIAGGERCYSVSDAKTLLDASALQVLQPDVVHAGGILETVNIATLANGYGVSIAPHNPNGEIATAASLTVDAVIPNFLIQEMLAPWDVPWRHDVVRGGSRVVDGYIDISSAPGLGVELDHDALRDHPFVAVDPALWSSESIMESVDLLSLQGREE